LRRLIPKAPPTKYPPDPPFKMPKYSELGLLAAWANQYAKQEMLSSALSQAKKTKQNIEYEVNRVANQITYPESLINEAVSDHLRRFGR